MKTMSFLNNKGGIGKTASVTTIAHILATEFKQRVLVVDMDPQGNTSSMYSKIDFLKIFGEIWNRTEQKSEASVEELLLSYEKDVRDCIYPTEYERLDILPSHMTLSEVEERMKADVATPQQSRLAYHLAKVEKDYDYCLIDCGPSIGLLNVNALTASDLVYIPSRCDGGSLIGIALTMNLIRTVQRYNFKLKLGGCFLTQYSGRKNIEKAVYGLLEEIFPEGGLLPVTIRSSKWIEESTLEQQPLLARDPKKKEKITREYLALTRHIMEGE